MSTKINYTVYYHSKAIDLTKETTANLTVAPNDVVDSDMVSNCLVETFIYDVVKITLGVYRTVYSEAELNDLIQNLLAKGYRDAKS